MKRLLRLDRRPPPSPLARLDARPKLVCLLAVLVAVVATPIAAWERICALAAVLALCAVGARLPARWLLRRACLLIPFLVVVAAIVCLAPAHSRADEVALDFVGRALSRGALLTAASVIVKSALTLFAFTVLLGATETSELLTALSALRVPRVVVALLTLAHRYLFVLADELSRMFIARDSRGRPRQWRRRLSTATAMAGALFVRAYERSERIAIAMVSRGFAGRFPPAETPGLPIPHVLAAAAFCGGMVLLAFW